MIKQKRALLKPYSEDYSQKGFIYFKGLPPKVAKKLMIGEPNVNPESKQNNSPCMSDMVRFALKWNGTLEGYATQPHRTDARITFDGFTIRVDDSVAKFIKNNLWPNEFDKTTRGWRFWWD